MSYIIHRLVLFLRSDWLFVDQLRFQCLCSVSDWWIDGWLVDWLIDWWWMWIGWMDWWIDDWLIGWCWWMDGWMDGCWLLAGWLAAGWMWLAGWMLFFWWQRCLLQLVVVSSSAFSTPISTVSISSLSCGGFHSSQVFMCTASFWPLSNYRSNRRIFDIQWRLYYYFSTCKSNKAGHVRGERQCSGGHLQQKYRWMWKREAQMICFQTHTCIQCWSFYVCIWSGSYWSNIHLFLFTL